jgi:hypothetical protein
MLVKSKIVELADWLLKKKFRMAMFPTNLWWKMDIHIQRSCPYGEFSAIDFRIVYLAFENAV